MVAYYSEFDPKAAAWLRELIARGLIAAGDVDERDLWDVSPDDLKPYCQVHLCAGIGVWSHSLRRAGWPDDRPVWTASFPCQPFSAAGKGEGFADERHLWPAGHHLIGECRPRTLFGEQVASKNAEPWLDLVQADLEGLGYAFGACAFASGVGAPHIRDRTYWVADAGRERDEPRRDLGDLVSAAGQEQGEAWGRQRRGDADSGSGPIGGLAHHHHPGLEGRGQLGRERTAERAPRPGGVARGLADDDVAGWQQPPKRDGQSIRPGFETSRRPDADGRDKFVILPAPERDNGRFESHYRPGPTNGLWRDADWLLCRDGKWRPVEPGTFPLAHGAPARVGRLRGYGNAINAEAAVAWIEAYLGAGYDPRLGEMLS